MRVFIVTCDEDSNHSPYIVGVFATHDEAIALIKSRPCGLGRDDGECYPHVDHWIEEWNVGPIEPAKSGETMDSLDEHFGGTCSQCVKETEFLSRLGL